MTEARPVLTAAEMRAAERQAIDAGTSIEMLMERAGAAVAEAAWRLAGRVETMVICGPGNNGGDGYVAARLLRARGVPATVARADEPETPAARAAADRWDGPCVALADAPRSPLVIDALFGTGLSRAIDPAMAGGLARLCARAQRRIAVDLPSGVATDDGTLPGPVPQFDLTVALGALKPAHLLLPAAARCGRVAVADIGLDLAGTPRTIMIRRPALAAPPCDATKYTRGKLVVLGGAMPGASLLAAMAGQRAGAGYVELRASDADAPPYSLVRRRWDASGLDDDRVRAVVVGPGLGLQRSARTMLDAALACGKPLVLDADALTLIGRTRHERLAGHVVTPHWGEFVRLFGDDKRDRLSQARTAAAASGAIVVLKGADTIVVHPDGRAAIAPLAPSWLASAGTGDVLAGIVGALLAGGRNAFEAAQGAVWIHAEAARLAGPMLIADDLIAHLPAAIAACL